MISGKADMKSVELYWWATKPNFGDLIGPWLVEMMTGRKAINVKDDKTKGGVATVGSILQSLNRPGLDVWGSGVLYRLSADKVQRLTRRKPRAIHALRGWHTYSEVKKKLGWKAPRIFGDPALLLPRYHTIRKTDKAGSPVVVPHYSHKKYFKGFEGIHVVDVQQDAPTVVNEIGSASCCVSTSLHGVIVAHSYGVPWVWLNIAEQGLKGGNFKFEDFFTVMNRDAVSAVTIEPGSITPSNMLALSNLASLPKNKFSFDSLNDSFPADFR